jgi:hypothetical protein
MFKDSVGMERDAGEYKHGANFSLSGIDQAHLRRLLEHDLLVNHARPRHVGRVLRVHSKGDLGKRARRH